jgi:pyruvate/2-oxoglutarate dehydrogenase complex dihydrolipoamide acyltransferase (E2) component
MPVSKLLGCDPQEVSPPRAGAVFAEAAKNLAEEQGIDLTAAWRKMKALEPDLHARMTQRDENDSTPVANAAQVFVPRNKATFLPTLGLPADTTDDEFAAIVRANGGTRMPLKARTIFPALVAAVAKEKAISVALARRDVLARFKDLSKDAGELPQ